MIESNDSLHLGLSYNTDRKPLRIPEYGRTVQQMVDHLLTIDDREARNKAARAVIRVMGEINHTCVTCQTSSINYGTSCSSCQTSVWI